jgi:hypothetical protein
MGHLLSLQNCARRALPVSNGVNNFATAVHAISSRKIARIPGLPGSAVRNNATVAYFDAAQFLN